MSRHSVTHAEGHATPFCRSDAGRKKKGNNSLETLGKHAVDPIYVSARVVLFSLTLELRTCLHWPINMQRTHKGLNEGVELRKGV